MFGHHDSLSPQAQGGYSEQCAGSISSGHTCITAFLVLVTFVSLATCGQPVAYGLPLYSLVCKVTSITFEIAFELNRCVIDMGNGNSIYKEYFHTSLDFMFLIILI